MDNAKMLRFFRSLSRQASRIMREKKDGMKKAGKNYFGDYSNRMDLYIENMVREKAREKGFGLITEEQPEKFSGEEGTIILDPLDGSKNYETGFPAYSFAIAGSSSQYASFDSIQASLVLDFANGTEYSSIMGKGIFINSEKFFPRKEKRRVFLVGGDFGGKPAVAKNVFPKITRFAYMRMLGASTIEMALLATGTLDGYIDVRGKLLATHTAGLALVRDSGAIITDWKGQKISGKITQDTVYTVVAARNASLHKKLLDAAKRI